MRESVCVRESKSCVEGQEEGAGGGLGGVTLGAEAFGAPTGHARVGVRAAWNPSVVLDGIRREAAAGNGPGAAGAGGGSAAEIGAGGGTVETGGGTVEPGPSTGAGPKPGAETRTRRPTVVASPSSPPPPPSPPWLALPSSRPLRITGGMGTAEEEQSARFRVARRRFVEQALRHVGKSYEAVDCCALVRLCVHALPKLFNGLRFDRCNQGIMLETLQHAVITDPHELRFGDLIFYTADCE